MARYRKCPRSCALGNTCRWKQKMLKQLPRLACPYFIKALSRVMLYDRKAPSPRLDIPAHFVQDHGDKFGRVVEVMGPCNKGWIMELRIQNEVGYNRVSLNHGWTQFTIANHLGEGDHLLFALTRVSKFIVYIFDHLGNKKRPPCLQPVRGCEDEHVIQNEKEAHKSIRKKKHSSAGISEESSAPAFNQPVEKQYGSIKNQRASGQCDKTRDHNGAQSFDKTDRDEVPKKLLVEPVVITLSDDQSSDHKSDQIAGKESEITSDDVNICQQIKVDQTSASESLQFTKTLAAVNLKGRPHCIHLEIPAEILQQHARLFRGELHLKGPTGRTWPVVCKVSPPHRWTTRVKLKVGWAAFAHDNMLKLYDQLLFTNTSNAHFDVQVSRMIEEEQQPSARQQGNQDKPGLATLKPMRKRVRKEKLPSRRQKCNQEMSEHEDHRLRLRKNLTDVPEEPVFQFQVHQKIKKLRRADPHHVRQHLSQRSLHKQTGEHDVLRRRGRMEWGDSDSSNKTTRLDFPYKANLTLDKFRDVMSWKEREPMRRSHSSNISKGFRLG